MIRTLASGGSEPANGFRTIRIVEQVSPPEVGDLSFQRELATNMVFGITYVGTFGRHLIVVDRDGRCTGVIGPRHVAQAHRLDLRRDDEIPVSDLGCAPWIALSPLDSMQTCAQMLVEYDVDAIPVLDGDQRVLGLVTSHGIARAAAEVPEHKHPRWRD